MTRGFISAKKSEGSAKLRPDGLKAASVDAASKFRLCGAETTNGDHCPQYAEAY